MPNLVQYESDKRIIGIYHLINDELRKVFFVNAETSTTHYVFPYGSYFNWYGVEWNIGYDPIIDVAVPGISSVYSYNVISAPHYWPSVDSTYFPNNCSQLGLGGGKSLNFFSITSTPSTNLKLYISGLCKANTNTNLSLSYAYSLDGSTNFTNIEQFNNSASLTTEWRPFIYVKSLNFGTADVKLCPIVWTGTYLYGPKIKDLTMMLVSDSLI